MKKDKLLVMVPTICANDIGYAENSVFQPGIVIRHKIKNGYFNAVPVFVIGDDRKSIRWVRLNKNYLKKIDAIGIITNTQSQEILTQIENNIGIKLVISNINGLEKIVGTTHYPFLIKDGWIFQ